MENITIGIVRFIAVVSLAVGAVAFSAGWLIATPKTTLHRAAADGYDDLIIHPETTPEMKWVKMTKQTRDALVDIYAANANHCNKFMHANDRVTIGEAAILWLMERKK